MMEPSAALKHWARWAVDNGGWRKTCYSYEGRFASDASRYQHAVDAENAEQRLAFRYDPRIGEQVERMVNTLPDNEKQAMRARHVHWPHLSDDIVARRLGISARSLDTVLLAATVRFGRAWRESQRVAA